jgi:hypothetical protein
MVVVILESRGADAHSWLADTIFDEINYGYALMAKGY